MSTTKELGIYRLWLPDLDAVGFLSETVLAALAPSLLLSYLIFPVSLAMRIQGTLDYQLSSVQLIVVGDVVI
jgi:hypothetical protein